MRRLMVVTGLALTMAMLSGCGGTKGPQTLGVALDIEFVDSLWQLGTVPYAGRCTQCGGSGMSPGLVVRNVPKKAKALVIEFANLTLKEPGAVADHGAYRVPTKGRAEVVVPSIPEQTLSLPEGVFVEREHAATTMPRGTYLAPCSCERLDRYEIVVTADKHEKWREKGYEILAQGRISLGYCCGD